MTGSTPDMHHPDGTRTVDQRPVRRRWLFAGVAATAALTGVALSWWRAQPSGDSAAQTLALWDMAFPTPGEETVRMRTFSGRPLLLNFWATWCPPCIEEMPLLDRFYAENSAKGWQVLGMAVDQRAAVNRFLSQTPVRFPVTLAGMAGVELSRSLGNQGGGLPFTVLFDGRGQIVQRKIGRLEPQDLQQWLTLR